jgi:transposase
MIQITPHMRIFLAVEPVDFRRGIDGLVALCRQKLKIEPFDGALFVFSSKRRKALKILCYDGQGYWLCQKRLSEGRFKWWPGPGEESTRALDAHQLQLLLWNGDPTAARAAPMWRPIKAAA